MQRHAVASDGQPLAALQAFAELQHDRRVQLADLDQSQVAGAGFTEQAVELFGVLGVHQHVHPYLFAQLGQRPAYLEVAQVRADQHLSACAT
ncbi:hypothetical protein D9M68_756340 [compost metagenome]